VTTRRTRWEFQGLDIIVDYITYAAGKLTQRMRSCQAAQRTTHHDGCHAVQPHQGRRRPAFARYLNGFLLKSFQPFFHKLFIENPSLGGFTSGLTGFASACFGGFGSDFGGGLGLSFGLDVEGSFGLLSTGGPPLFVPPGPSGNGSVGSPCFFIASYHAFTRFCIPTGSRLYASTNDLSSGVSC